MSARMAAKRHDLRLIRQIEDPIDVEHVQELRGLHEAALDLRLVLLVGLERQVQQRLSIARDGRQFLALLAGLLRRPAAGRAYGTAKPPEESRCCETPAMMPASDSARR